MPTDTNAPITDSGAMDAWHALSNDDKAFAIGWFVADVRRQCGNAWTANAVREAIAAAIEDRERGDK